MKTGVACIAAAAIPQADAYDWDPRSKIPGHGRRDVFDEGGPKGEKKLKSNLAPCPKVVELSPFWGGCMVDKVMYVRVDEEDDECFELLSMDDMGYDKLVNASKIQCGDGGHVWSTRIMEEMSVVYWAAGADRYGESDTVEIEMKALNGTKYKRTLDMTEEKFTAMKGCWFKGCGCPQAAISFEFKLGLTLIILACMAVFGWDTYEQTQKDKRRAERRERKRLKEERRLKKEKKKGDDTSSAADSSQPPPSPTDSSAPAKDTPETSD